jgi:hypothetical protein
VSLSQVREGPLDPVGKSGTLLAGEQFFTLFQGEIQESRNFSLHVAPVTRVSVLKQI